jgi:hypothetical protein
VTVPICAAAHSNRPDGKSAVYFADAVWQHKTATESGLDPARLKEATGFAVASEAKNPRDLVLNHYQTFGREPFGYAIGPSRIAATRPASSFTTATSWPNGAVRCASTWPTA